MVYFNSDGNQSSLCGNGGRCVTAFAQHLGIIDQHANFLAVDGVHESLVNGNGTVSLKMPDVNQIEIADDFYFLNTGSPHYVRFEEQVEGMDMIKEGRAVRYHPTFEKEGINVNLVALAGPISFQIRTYERGVEDETLACGTGVTAAALAAYFYQNLPPGNHQIDMQARGGTLSVRFTALADGTFRDIWLCGPAAFVFSGVVPVSSDSLK
jgi:diaminopimelate epimerase